MRDNDLDFTIARLGECRIPSPMSGVRFTRDEERVLYHSTLEGINAWLDRLDRGAAPPAMESAGPRQMLFFDPAKLACGIVTCGGLCPGLNDVIRAIVLSLRRHYGVNKVYGFRYGYEGLVRRIGHEPLELTPESVHRIHESGGSILGSSRGPQDAAEMVDYLKDLGVGILFAIGGDGTLRGAQKIGEEAARRGLKIGVIGVPKTIDNDVSFVQRTFGFETAVTEARRATACGQRRGGSGAQRDRTREADGPRFGVHRGLFGSGQQPRELLPGSRGAVHPREVSVSAAGSGSSADSHAVIVVAEGAGQDLMAKSQERDASGNVKYGDIGVFLRDAIKDHFKRIGMAITLKYIDPSYTIRSVPATPHDSAFCLLLGQSAVHAGLSGRTNMVVSFWNHQFTHVPIALAVSERKKIDPEGALWNSVVTSTGQPRDMR